MNRSEGIGLHGVCQNNVSEPSKEGNNAHLGEGRTTALKRHTPKPRSLEVQGDPLEDGYSFSSLFF